MDHDFDVWEAEIAAYEAADTENPPPKHALLFTGSSTIALWHTLAQDFPEHQVINRGFGGSEPVDSTHFADRIIFPYEPSAIFFYSGVNALGGGKSPAQTIADIREFLDLMRARLPEADVFFISLIASVDRWYAAEQFREVNGTVRGYCEAQPHLTYIDVFDLALGSDGKPRPECFVEDGLHLSAEGYKLLAERVRPYLPGLIS
jgi:hypothetical protein